MSSGKLYDKQDAKISVYDHGLLYGDGVFEGIRSYSGKVFRMEQHLDRLWNSAKAIWLKIPMTKEEMGKAIYDTLKEQRDRGRVHPRGGDAGIGDLGSRSQPVQRSPR